MIVEILGSGGSFTTPKPGCDCKICNEARAKGVPYSRTGPSVFIHGPNVLIDTPEESKIQLNRAGIKQISCGIYSHWHGDHVLGYRMWWNMNYDFKHVHPKHTKTPIYLPGQVAEDFKTRIGVWNRMTRLEKQGVISLIILQDGESIDVSGAKILPFRLPEEGVYGFILSENGKRVLIAMDDIFQWNPGPEFEGFDLAVLPMGIAEFDPLTGHRKMRRDHLFLQNEATFNDTLSIIRKLKAKRVVLIHIEEHDGLSYDELELVSKELACKGLDVKFAFDSMKIEA